jgi:hypothetical protein
MNLDASPALSVLCTDEFSIIRSSIGFAWSGFRLERQLASERVTKPSKAR